MTKAQKITLWIHTVLRLFIIGAAVIAIFNNDWASLMLAILIFILTFLPSLVSRTIDLHYPSAFEVFGVLFIYASLYLGEIHKFYTKFWWWDVVLHMTASLAFGAVGFSLVYVLNASKKRAVKLSPFFISMFAFTFAISLGVLWEVIEFALDAFLGLNMQKSGLRDTMGDLMVDSLGAFLISGLGYGYVKKGYDPFRDIAKKLSK